MSERIEIVRALVAMGLRIHPLCTPGSHRRGHLCDVVWHNVDRETGAVTGCGNAGKISRIGKWPQKSSIDLAVIEQWLRWWPTMNLGSAMGEDPSRPDTDTVPFALDIDGPAGRDSVARLEREHGPLPTTACIRTGRAEGGEARIYRAPRQTVTRFGNTSGALAPGLDIRATGGQVVLPPSLHKSGNLYQWLDDDPIADLPASHWL
jgi:hypothetical protein